MTLEKARAILAALLYGDADCRCGNFAITNEVKEAIELILSSIEDQE